MFSAWAAIPIRSWAAVIMSAAAEQPPHTLPPPGANFCCFRLREGIKTSRKRDGLSVSSYFFLGSHWCPPVTPEQGCQRTGMSPLSQGGKRVPPKPPENTNTSALQDSLQASSFQKCSSSLLQLLLGLWKAPFQPMGFLCSHCPLWRWGPHTSCPWIVTFFPLYYELWR